MLKARLRYYATLGRGNPSDFITQEAHARHGVVHLMYLPIEAWLTTRRDILLLLSDCKFLRFTVTAMRFTSHFDGSLAPKVVQIIVSYNNLHAFFAIFRVFGGFFEIFGANFGSQPAETA